MKKTLSLLCCLLVGFSLFASLTLEDLEKSLLENNGTLRQANESVRSAALDLKDAKANFSPSISLTGTATYMVNPPVGAITMESSEILSQMGLGAYATPGYVTLYDGMDNTMLMGSLSLTQPIFTWGKLTDAVSLYSNALSATSLQRDDKKGQLLSELKVRVWALKYMKELEVLLDEAEGYAEDLLGMAETAYRTGLTVKTDYLAAKVSSSETSMRLLELENQKAEMLSALRTLVGDGSLTMDDIVFPEKEEELFSFFDEYTKEDVVALALESSLSLAAAKELLGVYTLQERIARKTLYGIPDFALQTSLSYSGSRIPFVDLGWRQNDDYSLNLTLAFTTTLWDGGKLKNSVEKAKSSVLSTTALIDDASLQIQGAVESNWNSLSYLKASMAWNEAKIESAREELGAIETEVKYGQKGRKDEVEKRLEIVTKEAELVAQKITFVQNVLTLQYLIGRN